MIFKGSGVALVTPFNNDMSINFSVLENLIDYHLDNDTDAIIVCGTTGEASSLSMKEKLSVLKFCLDKVSGKIPVIMGAGSNNTAEAIEFSKKVASMGTSAILSVCPYYNKPSQLGLKLHFEAIANNVDIPIILYNSPSRTGVNIQPSTVLELSTFDNIVAIKECNFSQVAKIKQLCGSNIDIYSGNDDEIVPMLSLGAIGVISVLANILPKETHSMCQYFFENNIFDSRKLQLEYISLIESLFSESNPVPVKEALNLLGINVGSCRPPLSSLMPSTANNLLLTLKKYGLYQSKLGQYPVLTSKY